MLAELRWKSRITIPKEMIIKLGLSEGDKLDIFEKDGAICMISVVVYPKKYQIEAALKIKRVAVIQINTMISITEANQRSCNVNISCIE